MDKLFLENLKENILKVIKKDGKQILENNSEKYEIELSPDDKISDNIIIKTKDISITYNVKDNSLVIHSDRLEKYSDISSFIVKLLNSFKEIAFIKHFAYISQDFKFEFSEDTLYLYVKHYSSKIEIIDGEFKINAFSDMQDNILAMFCELKDYINLKAYIEEFIDNYEVEVLFNRQLLLDIISWYIILGGEVNFNEKFEIGNTSINSFEISENLLSYVTSQMYIPKGQRDKLYYGVDGNIISHKMKDMYDFYAINKSFKKDENIFNYRKIFKKLSEMKKLAKRKDLSFAIHSPYFPDVEHCVILTGNEVTLHKNDKKSVSNTELEELRYISEINGYNIYVLFSGGYYEITDCIIKKF